MLSGLLRPVRRWMVRHLAAGDALIIFGGGALTVLAVGGFWAFATGVHPDVWVPVLLLICLTLISVPVCLRTGRGDRRLKQLLVAALILKLLCVFPRYYVNEIVYDGEADTGNYHVAGQTFVQNLREEGKWSIEGSYIDAFPDETRIIGYVAGVLYLAVGTTYLGGYIIFAWLSWVGLLCFFRAFQVAFPRGRPYLCASLIFFLPSALYWPSSIGKDAVMVFALGILTLGMARILTPARPVRGAVLLVAPAAWLILQVRPHLLMVALVGGIASIFARSGDRSRTLGGTVSKAVLLAALIPGLMVGLGRMNDLFGEENGTNFDVASTLTKTNSQTSIGGSAFEARPINSPIDVPVAVVSVLYRPFPFEVSSLPVLISSMEGAALLVLTFVAGRWIWRVIVVARTHAVAGFCLAYVLAFVFAFSNVGNAGILARQRVQMFPVLMILVAAAREHHRLHSGQEDHADDASDTRRPHTEPALEPRLVPSP